MRTTYFAQWSLSKISDSEIMEMEIWRYGKSLLTWQLKIMSIIETDTLDIVGKEANRPE